MTSRSTPRPTDPPEPGLLDKAPLPLAGALSALGAGASSLVLVVLPFFVAWLASTASTVSAGQSLEVGGDLWLMAHGVGLHTNAGAVTLTPWLLLAVPLLTLRWGAQRILAGVADRDAGPALLGGLRRDVGVAGACFVGAYAALAFVVALIGRFPGLAPTWWSAPLLAALWAAAVFAWQAVREFRTRGTDLAPRARWAWREYVPWWLRRAIGPAARGAALLVGFGAIGVLVLVAANLTRVVGLYGDVGAGWVGGVVLTLGQLCYLPTLAMWAVSFAAGPGFGLGEGSSITWTQAQPGPMPLVPVLGALPDPGPLPEWTLAAVAAPVLVGFVVAWLALRGPDRPRSGRDRLRLAAAAVGLCALLLTGLVVAAGGSLGSARLAHVGPVAWLVGPALLGELALGGFVAWALSGLRLRRRRD